VCIYQATDYNKHTVLDRDPSEWSVAVAWSSTDSDGFSAATVLQHVVKYHQRRFDCSLSQNYLLAFVDVEHWTVVCVVDHHQLVCVWRHRYTCHHWMYLVSVLCVLSWKLSIHFLSDWTHLWQRLFQTSVCWICNYVCYVLVLFSRCCTIKENDFCNLPRALFRSCLGWLHSRSVDIFVTCTTWADDMEGMWCGCYGWLRVHVTACVSTFVVIDGCS